LTAALGALALVFSGSAGTAVSGTMVVTATAAGQDTAPGDGACMTSGGGCTLSAAVEEAAAVGGGRIRLPAATYHLDRELHLTGELTIWGTPKAIITDERIVVEEGATVTLMDLTVRDIDRTFPGSGCGAGIENKGTLHLIRVDVINNRNRNPGGGICNHGTLTMAGGEISSNASVFTGNGGGLYNEGDATLTDVVVKDNYTNGPGSGYGEGGGIKNAGILTLVRTRVQENEGDGAGGGLYNGGRATVDASRFANNDLHTPGGGPCCIAEGSGIHNEGELTMTNTTIEGNTANGGPGGFANDGTASVESSTISGNSFGGISNAGTLSLRNSTISGNFAGDSPDVAGYGGILNRGTLEITNSTITGNTPTYTATGGILALTGAVTVVNSIVAANGGGQCAGAIRSLGHNLSNDASCGFNEPGDIEGLDALLEPLADNGGPTLTHALNPDSPAVDAGDNSTCPGKDQRGAERPVNGVCDIGAYEFGGELPTPSPTHTPTPTPQWRVDVNCDGRLTAADAMLVLRYVGGLPLDVPAWCPSIGTLLFPATPATSTSPTVTGTPPRETPQYPERQGDADCLGGVTPVDALIILRLIARLPYWLVAGCPPLE